MTAWMLAPFLTAFLTYVGASYWASRLLPGERRRLGDTRPVPDFLNPLTSHRWLPILLLEKTRGFRPLARRAFSISRIALFLTPVAFFVTMVLAANFPVAGQEAGRNAPPPVTLTIPD